MRLLVTTPSFGDEPSGRRCQLAMRQPSARRSPCCRTRAKSRFCPSRESRPKRRRLVPLCGSVWSRFAGASGDWAGYENSTPLLTPEAVSLIAHYGDGIPRNINNICFNSLSIGCTSGKKVIDAEAVREAIADLGLEGSKFGEPTDDLGWQGARFAEPTDDAGLQGETFAEPTDDLGWQRARFANPVGDSEPDEDEFAEPDLSEERETSPGLRVALIAGLLFATALAVAGWNVARSGGPHSPLMSQVTSWFHNSPPVKNQPQVQAPALPQTPASPQVDQSAQTSIRQQRESAAQAATPSQDDSSLQSAIPSQAKPANEGTAQASPFFGVSKPNRERSGAKLRASRGTIPKGGVEVVGARQGQSVAGICVERFNGCSPALLNTIVELNPGIKDQDHLEAGQRVFLPVIESRPQQRN